MNADGGIGLKQAEASKDDELMHSVSIAKGTAWALSGSLLMNGLSFFYTIYVARAVSQGDLGLFYLSLSIAMLFGVWRDFGLPAALTRYVPFYEGKKEYAKIRALLRSTYFINVLSGAALTLLLFLLSGFIGGLYQNPLLPEALRLMSAYMLLECIFRVNVNFLQSRSDIRSQQMAYNVLVLSKFAFTILFFSLFGASLVTLTAAFLLSYLAAIAASAPDVRMRVKEIPSESQPAPMRTMLSEVIPFGLMLTVLTTLNTIVSSIDRALLGLLSLPADANSVVAIYSVSSILALCVAIFPNAVGSIFLPTISKLIGKGDREGAKKALATSQRWSLFIMLPFAAVMTAFSQEMIVTVYGGDYSSGALPMAIFVSGLALSAFSSAPSSALAALRMVKLELKIAAITAAFNVCLMLLFVPSLGMEGAALSFAASFILSAFIIEYYTRRIVGYSTPKSVFTIMLIGALLCCLLLFAKPAVAFCASLIPNIGIDALQPYFYKAAYFALLGILSAICGVALFALAIAAKCLGRQDALVASKVGHFLRLPKPAIALIEKAVGYGVGTG